MKNPASTISPPNRNNQYATAFSLGKATSGAPIWSGMITFANPANSGVANSSSITVPWMVKSWLYCCWLTICMPGAASSALMNMAITPAIRKNPNEVIR